MYLIILVKRPLLLLFLHVRSNSGEQSWVDQLPHCPLRLWLCVCVCVCVWDAFCFNELLFGRVATRGESVAELTPDPATLHKTPLTTPHQGCICVPSCLFPSPQPKKTNLMSTLHLVPDIFRLCVFLSIHTCSWCVKIWSSLAVYLSPSWCLFCFCSLTVRVISHASREWFWTPCHDPSPSVLPSLPLSQPMPCFCFPPRHSVLPPPPSSDCKTSKNSIF